MPVSPELLSEIANRRQVYLERYKSTVYNKYDPFLQKIARTIRTELAGHNLTEWGRTRLEKQLRALNKDLRILQGTYIDGEFIPSSLDLARYEAGAEVRSMSQVVKYNFEIPSETQLKTAVMTNPLGGTGFEGKLLEPFVRDLMTVPVDNVVNAIRDGAYRGLTTPKIIRNIIGTKKLGYTDGELQKMKLATERMVRTGLQHVSNQARQETWKRNSDIIDGWKLVVTFDGRTSQICRNLGQERATYKIGEGPIPPIHIFCRSTTTPAFSDKFAKAEKIIDKDATRAARDEDGNVYKVDADQGYYDWLKTQSAEFQDSVVGPTRGKLLRGGMTADRFAELNMSKDFKPLTTIIRGGKEITPLMQMREMEPIAFNKMRNK